MQKWSEAEVIQLLSSVIRRMLLKKGRLPRHSVPSNDDCLMAKGPCEGRQHSFSGHCETRSNLLLFIKSMSTFVYIMTNKNNTVLYTGVTNNLARRVAEHRSGEGSVFTKRYQIKKLVFCKPFDRPVVAIAAEKKIKAGSRQKKIALIEEQNPFWRDLIEDL